MSAVAHLDSLLTLQEIDTTLDQLRHRRETLPERAELVAARKSVKDTTSAVDAAYARFHEVESAEKAQEDEAASIEEKVAGVERMLYGGTVKAAKELEAYQTDLGLLKERQTMLEDQALELMEQAEPLKAELAERQTEADAAKVLVSQVEDRLVVAEAEVDAEIDKVQSGRSEAASSLPADVVEQYEALRRSLGGTGAARLTGARCEGCHLEIPSAQLEQVRRAPEDAVVNCPECGRILVR